MKALTLRNPWPWAVCADASRLPKPKRIENRTWHPSHSQLRQGERFAIHAGKMPSVIEIREAFVGMAMMGAIDETTKVPTLAELRKQESAIVAVATYGGWTDVSESKWFCGPVGWVLDSVLVLPRPVPCRGMQGLWDVPADVLERMRAQFRTGS